jgi:hypothetical protein
VCRPDPGELPAEARYEIQARTVLEHAWAEIEHDLGYRSRDAVPDAVRRRLNRLAGLLELADQEFVAIRRELTDYAARAAPPDRERGEDHPHPTYVALSARLHDLAVGIHGERAGDLLLIAHDGGRERPGAVTTSRRRIARGMAAISRRLRAPADCCRPEAERGPIGRRVRRVLGDRLFQQKVAEVMVELRH